MTDEYTPEENPFEDHHDAMEKGIWKPSEPQVSEPIRLLRQLRNSSEWLGDDNIGSTARKKHEALQKEAFTKLVDLFCKHDWVPMNLGGAVKLFECRECKVRRLEEEILGK